MDLVDRLQELAKKAEKQLPHLKTEEATKTALVMPFIQALGYNVFDPTEVVPEFTADVGTKKGEKVDYAILQDAKPAILFECKWSGCDLDQAHASQLYRYFSVTSARFGILTNGVEYRIFSDLEEPNRMDARPFLEFDIRDVSPAIAAEVKRFARDSFDVEDILSTASELKYTKGMRRALAEEWANPTEEFVRLLTARVYPGRFTQPVREQFTAIAKKALHEFLNARVNERLTAALERDSQDKNVQDEDAADEPDDARDGIVTTEEELDGFYVVKAIVREVVNVKRVFLRDTKSYCGVLLDDNNRKQICRLRFNSRRKYIGLFDESKQETRHAIADVSDIYSHAAALKATATRFAGE